MDADALSRWVNDPRQGGRPHERVSWLNSAPHHALLADGDCYYERDALRSAWWFVDGNTMRDSGCYVGSLHMPDNLRPVPMSAVYGKRQEARR